MDQHTHRICVAPMVDRTDRHFRYLMRLLSKRVLLYSEMHTTPAILKGKAQQILRQADKEENCVLQIAGDSPEECYEAITRVELLFNYSQYNLNVGCPSQRIQNARYGAVLMRQPLLVKELLKAMKKATHKEISAKIRLGVKNSLYITRDTVDLTKWEQLKDFVETIAESGIHTIQVHARLAVLDGLSPKDNRQIPPLQRDWVYRLGEVFPKLSFIMNGGIQTLCEIKEILNNRHIKGVMIGRAAYDNPYLLAHASRLFLGEREPIPTRREILERMRTYMVEQKRGLRDVHLIYPHLMGLLYGQAGAKNLRQILSPPYTTNEDIFQRFDKLFKELPTSALDKTWDEEQETLL